jgi:3-deoxy-D-manno-octulosonic acid (KDO) 8-phosphate synthase
MQLLGREVGLDQPLFLIAGPCVVESEELQMCTAERLKCIADKLGILAGRCQWVVNEHQRTALLKRVDELWSALGVKK